MSSGQNEGSRLVSRPLTAVLDALLPSRIQGFVDSAVAGEIVGWALDAARSHRRVHVVARAGGVIVAETLADLPRRDLIELGRGDGRHGFRLRIPGDLSEEARRKIRVEVTAKPRNVILKRGKVSLPAPSAPSAKPASGPGVKTGAACGFLERCAGGEVVGWAVDPRQPHATTSVDIYNDEVFLGAIVCDRDRASLAGGRAPAGAKGFVFALPTGVAVGAGEQLRARISGSRLELGRSRFYPGDRAAEASADPVDGATEREDPFPEPVAPQAAPARAARPVAPTPRRAQTSGVVFLICGSGEEAAFVRTEQSCLSQTSPAVRCLRASASVARDELFAATAVVFLQPGQVADAGLAGALLASAPGAEAWAWRIDRSGAGVFPEAQLLLSGGRGGFAASGWALAKLDAGAVAATLAGDVRGLASSLSTAGVRWCALDAPLTEAPNGGVLDAGGARPAAPDRISLAIWTGWENGPPPALAGLLAGCAGAEVEILTPAQAATPDLLATLHDAAAGVRVRVVDAPHEGRGGLWRALTQAATGQVVVLARGDIVLNAPARLLELCAWAAAPSVGAVTVRITGRAQPVGGLSLHREVEGAVTVKPATPGDGVRFADAAPAEFMICARERLARVGGLDAVAPLDGFADLVFGLKLADEGLPTLVFGDMEARTTPMTGRLAEMPLPAAAQALMGGRRYGLTAAR